MVKSKDGAALPPRYHCRTRTGQRASIDEEEFRLLTLVDGKRTIAEIAGLLSTETAGSVAEKVMGLQQRGFVALRVGEGDGSLRGKERP